MAFANRLACLVISSCSSRLSAANLSYFVPMSTGIAVCVREHKLKMAESIAYLVKTSRLAVPLLDTVERCFPCQVEHEQDRDGIVRDKRQHRYEFTLSTEIPNLCAFVSECSRSCERSSSLGSARRQSLGRLIKRFLDERSARALPDGYL
jgi:hypothetical protein